MMLSDIKILSLLLSGGLNLRRTILFGCYRYPQVTWL